MHEQHDSGQGYSIERVPPAEDVKSRKGRRASKALRPDDGPILGLPIIKVVAGRLPAAVDQAEEAIINAGSAVYVRGGTLVRPVIEPIEASNERVTMSAKLKKLCNDSLSDILARTATFQRWSERANDWKTIDPPSKLASTLLAREGEWRFGYIAGVITAPILRPDGSLLDTPGYDPATRLYLEPDPALRAISIPEEPTREQAHEALRLLSDLIAEFPFVEDVDRAVALSGILTALARPGLPTAPLHAIRATTPGTGKSCYVDVVSTIATGRRCPVISPGKTEEEAEKRLGATLLEAVPIISIDNVNGELGGTFLCQAAERPSVKVRPLGVSKTVNIDVRSAIFSTGNNLTLVGDMVRRAVLCRLDAEVERPEERTFPFDPVERVLSDRATYVAAALILLRAYRAAGSPERLSRLGSYEGWSDTVRSALVWLGEADPVSSMNTVREQDPELAAIRELFAHWERDLGMGAEYTSSAIKQAVDKTELKFQTGEGGGVEGHEFRDLLLRVAGHGGTISPRRLGIWLSKISGRVVGSRRLVMRVDKSHGNRWSLEEAPRTRLLEEGVGHAPHP